MSNTINDIYNSNYFEFINYLCETNIRDFCYCFVKFYTNKVLHFNTIVMSHNKENIKF